MISRRKKEFLENSSKAFDEGKQTKEKEVPTKKLYAQIGQLKVKI
ncbi:hypothetical protein [uncultured Eudoraea sp.]|nr:hypothetical protein [uncultured Eudoraea sp.]